MSVAPKTGLAERKLLRARARSYGDQQLRDDETMRRFWPPQPYSPRVGLRRGLELSAGAPVMSRGCVRRVWP